MLFGALIGFWYAYNQNKSSTQHLKRMMRDMESLQKAETALEDLQVNISYLSYYNISLLYYLFYKFVFRKNLRKQNKNKSMLAQRKQI